MPIWPLFGNFPPKRVSLIIAGVKQMKVKKRQDDLNKPVRHLKLLLALSHLIEEKGSSPGDVYRGLVKLIPNAWLYPENTCARLTLDGQHYATPNWQQTACSQAAGIKVRGKPWGQLEVCYTGSLEDSCAGPFLDEERELIDAVAERLGHYIERRQAEDALFESELKYRNVVENAGDAIIVAQEGIIKYINSCGIKLTGYSLEELTSRPFTSFIHPDDREYVLQRHMRRTKGEEVPYIYEFRLVDRHGRSRWVEINAALAEYEGKPATLNFLRDITERKTAQQELSKLAAIVHYAAEMVNLSRLDGSMVFLNQAGVQMLGINPEDIGQTNIMQVIPKKWQEKVQNEILPALGRDETWEGDLQYLNLKTGEPVDVHAVTFTIRDEISSQPLYFANISLDITGRKQAEEKLVQSYDKLKKTVRSAINTMARIAELKDPYAAGREQRVAALSTAIARELKLDDEAIENIQNAAIIYDIGKIYLPMHVLGKPGKLSGMETDLIRGHAEKGYEVLQDMDLPGAIAQSVLQHHERLNGSGYPWGLKEKEISLGARILAVADVLEAMTSPRPYRPAFSIEAALEEIQKNRGTLYDPDVVDVCLKLFTEKGFKLR